MAAVESGQPRAHGKGKKHKKRRLAVRIDMTPMVDVAFLLLTFFMLTTVFSKPQTMEITLPPDEKTTVEVAESNLLTLRINAEGAIFYNIGNDKPEPLRFEQVRPLLLERNAANPRLITLVKVDRDGTYKMLVDIMDELNLANITRFSIAPMLDVDKEILLKAGA
jgi:biopolymer transport protein ExbD